MGAACKSTVNTHCLMGRVMRRREEDEEEEEENEKQSEGEREKKKRKRNGRLLQGE